MLRFGHYGRLTASGFVQALFVHLHSCRTQQLPHAPTESVHTPPEAPSRLASNRTRAHLFHIMCFLYSFMCAVPVPSMRTPAMASCSQAESETHDCCACKHICVPRSLPESTWVQVGLHPRACAVSHTHTHSGSSRLAAMAGSLERSDRTPTAIPVGTQAVEKRLVSVAYKTLEI